MVNQDRLINKVHSLTLDTFPRSLIISGEEGSGRHSLLEIISNHLQLQSVDITEEISYDYITGIYLKPEPCIYYIEASKLSIKDQNALLKLVEEPLKNSFIIFLVESISSLLPTILNRCQKWSMNLYSVDDLRSFCSDEVVLQYCSTPGQIKYILESALDGKLRDMEELADKIIDRVIVSSFSNVLTICDKIDFKGTDKFPFGLFVKVLKKRVTKKISLSSDPMYFKLYDRTSKLCNDAKIFNINKQQLFENYLDDLKTMMVAE